MYRQQPISRQFNNVSCKGTPGRHLTISAILGNYWSAINSILCATFKADVMNVKESYTFKSSYL